LQIYISTQLFGLTDGSNLPNKALHIIDAYLSMIEYKVSVTAYNGDDLVDGMLFIPRDQAQPPQIKPNNIKAPALLIDLFDIWRQIKKDADSLEKINRGIKENISPALATLETHDRHPLIESMLNKLRHYSRKSPRKNPAGTVSLNVFIGFSKSHKAISNLADNAKETDNTDDLMHVLSKSSSGISIDNQQNIDESWHLADVSEGGLRIQTQISKYTTKISVGQIVAYSINENSDIENIELGYISLINRSSELYMDISIVKLCKTPQAIIVRDYKRQGKDSAMVGFIINNTRNAKQLALPNSWHAMQQQELSIAFQNQEQKIMTKRAALQQREFTVFDFSPVG
jgi:hypothetical protein